MSLPVVTRPAAAAEIETAYRWYEREREGLGSEFLEALQKMVNAIAENPERFPTLRKDIRRAVLRRFPYSIFTASFPGMSWSLRASTVNAIRGSGAHAASASGKLFTEKMAAKPWRHQ